ncbi:hypothetical protein A2973_00255 [Candidatus Gottesmanbacteria bacterium RIFCSPLOWO2_01_FULL_49_10]|uniref:Uncharacterized protein n=1 Tax=Candidatus Gottesmanbacteria bacterium RIFCSPLOWO2_01_FULL_49_10 TaxID=1798396 RepID=A0A1F6AZJ1_9BACT|nr:MAG: hypothetical protein A2973_00255 [Candidatus Gottesmanbacteria bacterium RIFCSPLOWO2_01_FULL_49_10]
MSHEQNPPINRTPPGESTLAEALAEQYARETGDGDPDGYLKREAPSTQAERAHREATVKANQPE